ncbi:hypothetical protein LSAT2_016022 [Lamellibrachia satsuma]|nr:hypothetical protein LSAT2_016022 [Lamellibrachia satsuma]
MEILQVGVTVFRYTSHEHARPWLIYSLKNVKGRGGDDVLELPVGLELPGYFPVREIPSADASVATTKPACVSNTSEAGEGQTVATKVPPSGVTGLSDTNPHETTKLAMKRQLFESTLESAPPHKRLHLDTVTTDVQNKYVADLSQVTSVEVQTSKSPEHVKVKRQLSTSIVAMTTDSDQPLLKSPPPVQHLVMHGDLVTQGPSDTVTLGRSCRSLTTQLSFKTVSPKRRTTVSVKATKDRSPTAVKLQATSVAAARERSPAAVTLQATSVAATRDRSPTAVKLQATSVAATRDRSPVAVKLQATSVTATRDRSPTAVKLQTTSVVATKDRSPTAVKLQATSVAATRDRSPAAVKLQATSVAATRDRSPTAVTLQATSVAATRDRSPAAVKLQATSVAAARDKSQAFVKLQATSVAATRDRSPAAVKLQATSVAAAKDRSPAAVKLQATPVAAAKDKSQAVVKLQATSVAATRDRSPAAVKLQATSVAAARDRSPAAVKLQATSVTTTRDRSPAAAKLQSTSVTAIRDRSPAPVKLQATPVAATRARSPAAAKLQATSVTAISSHMSQGSPSQQLTLDPNILAAITKSGVRGPFRLQLPANLKLPTSGLGQKVRFSVMSKTEAAKLGLGCSTAVTMPAGQPQMATSQPTNIQPPTKITVPPSCQCGNTASESSTVITLPSLKATHPSESSSKHPAGGTSVLTVKTKLVTKGTGKKDDSVPQLDGTTDDHVDGGTVDQESQRKSFSVDDKLKGPCDDNVSHVNGLLFDDTSVIPQLDGTADGESPNKSDNSDNVNTQPDDVIAQSDDVIAQSDDVIAQSDDVIAQSDDVITQSVDMLPVGSTDTEGIGRKGTDEDREENHREHQTVKNERPERTRHPVKLSLDSPENKCNYRKVRLVARPWKTPEGTVNRPTLKMMLEAVMMFIMTKPGVTRGDLITKYNPLLHPVPLMELTEMLQELGCVKQCIVGRSHKPSVFAPKAKLSQVAMDTGEEVVTYIPTVDCIIKLGQFEAQLSR